MELLASYCQGIDETVVVDYHFRFDKLYQTDKTARYNVMYGTLKIGEFGVHLVNDEKQWLCIYADNITAHIPSFPHKFLASDNTWDGAARIVQYYEKFVQTIVCPILEVHGVEKD
ncbi:hypothetical protein BNJ_00147 [Kaumoebavirus]|uniref:hypothetical protein n=1 Tax=Kaumoebavirus TaxID=1859492 RepID=UPI0009C1F795|nr:hypothetical protein BNJ_00147 [Kaumoebavirus]ARA71979.1 hypothetical protein BNJ_00147 [Kaumoebavirus]